MLLYELLVGQTPFDAKEMIKGGIDALRRIIREKEPARPSTRLKTPSAIELTSTAQRRQTDASRLTHSLRKAKPRSHPVRFDTDVTGAFRLDAPGRVDPTPIAGKPLVKNAV